MSNLRQRTSVSKTDFNSDYKDAAPQNKTDPELKHGLAMQVLRSLLLATWFNGCCVVIFVTQLIGAPLYFVSKDYFYAYMAWTKQCFGILITTVTRWGAPTMVRVSGDQSVRGQLHLTRGGQLKTEFP